MVVDGIPLQSGKWGGKVAVVEWLWSIAVCVLLLAMTVPRLQINFGLDGDCIRGVIAAKELVAHGTYWPSRLPGNPLFEYLLAVLSLLDGPVLTNSVVLAFYGLCIAAFASITKGRENRLILVSLFSLTPILVVNAASTIDYIPGLAITLWSYAFAMKGRFGWAYVCLGLSVGLRLSNSLFAIPLGLFLVLQGAGWARTACYTFLGAVMGLIAYSPIFIQNGLATLKVPPNAYGGLDYAFFTVYKFVNVLGPLATLGIAIILLTNVGRIFGFVEKEIEARNPAFLTETASVAAFMLLFLRHSDESEYLIPAIPFAYLLIGRWLDRRQLILVITLVLSYAFFTVELKGGESGHRKATFKPEQGIVLKDFEDRNELEALRRGITRFDKSAKAVIIHGYGPVLGFENGGLVMVDFRAISRRLDENGVAEKFAVYKLADRDVYLVSGVSRDNLDILRSEGYQLYYFSESAPSHLMHTWGYDPAALGLTRIDVLGEKAFYK